MEKTDKGSPLTGVLIIVLVMLFVALPVLYVLSLGPAIWLTEHGYIGEGAARTFYSPLIALHDAFPDSIGAALEWYARLFE